MERRAIRGSRRRTSMAAQLGWLAPGERDCASLHPGYDRAPINRDRGGFDDRERDERTHDAPGTPPQPGGCAADFGGHADGMLECARLLRAVRRHSLWPDAGRARQGDGDLAELVGPVEPGGRIDLR